jgi:hypothetical protein
MSGPPPVPLLITRVPTNSTQRVSWVVAPASAMTWNICKLPLLSLDRFVSCPLNPLRRLAVEGIVLKITWPRLLENPTALRPDTEVVVAPIAPLQREERSPPLNESMKRTATCHSFQQNSLRPSRNRRLCICHQLLVLVGGLCTYKDLYTSSTLRASSHFSSLVIFTPAQPSVRL